MTGYRLFAPVSAPPQQVRAYTPPAACPSLPVSSSLGPLAFMWLFPNRLRLSWFKFHPIFFTFHTVYSFGTSPYAPLWPLSKWDEMNNTYLHPLVMSSSLAWGQLSWNKLARSYWRGCTLKFLLIENSKNKYLELRVLINSLARADLRCDMERISKILLSFLIVLQNAGALDFLLRIAKDL